MFISEKEHTEIKNALHETQRLVEELREQNSNLQSEIDRLQSANKSGYDFEFDIEGMDVYAIEFDLDKNVTIISYIDNSKLSENSHNDFYLNCSKAQHNRLVKRFRKKLKLI